MSGLVLALRRGSAGQKSMPLPADHCDLRAWSSLRGEGRSLHSPAGAAPGVSGSHPSPSLPARPDAFPCPLTLSLQVFNCFHLKRAQLPNREVLTVAILLSQVSFKTAGYCP